MKNLRTTLTGVCLLSFITLTAQVTTVPINEQDLSKPKLFQQLPDVIPVNIADLDALINQPVGKTISVNLAERSVSSFQLEGAVVAETKQPENRIQTISIRTSNFPGASFTVSRIINADGSIRYTGRIISFRHADLLELQQKDGQLVFVKRNFYDLVNE